MVNTDPFGSCQDGFLSSGLAVCGESISASVGFLDPGDFCSNDGVQTNLGGGTPVGGTYMGPGVTDDLNGTTFTFDPAAAGVGPHTLTYTNGNSATVEIIVFQDGSTTFSAFNDLCIDAGIQTNLGGGSPAGGTYSGPGVTDNGDGTYDFNPALAGLGVHTITYTDPTPCGDMATDQVEVLAACGCPNGEMSFFHCYDNDETDLVIFEVCPTAGAFAEATIVSGSYGAGDELTVYEGASGSGTSGLAFGMFTGILSGNTFTASNPDNCLIFVSNSNFILSCQDGLETPLSVCGRSLTNLVTFTALDDLSFNAGVQTGLSGGLPVGGEYGGPGVTDGMDGMTYSFDPVAAGLGTHVLTYTVNGEIATDEVVVFNLTPPTFGKSFSPNTVNTGAVSVLTFTIDNAINSNPVMDLDFTDNFPAGMVVADIPNVVSTCVGGTITANAGASSISYTGGMLASNSSCTISVNVTSTTIGINTNTSGDLTSDAGNSGTASANLEVLNGTDRPVFTKSFNPDVINLGERSTLTFTIDNSMNSSAHYSMRFQDQLPNGLVVAAPANISLSSGCINGVVTAVPGTSEISYAPFNSVDINDARVEAGATCQITVDVESVSSGNFINVTEELTSNRISPFASNLSSGIAVDEIEVLTPPEIFIEKAFNPNPVRPGETTTLEFTITNLDRDLDATNVSFTDDLSTVLAGLVATNTPVSSCGGTLTGTSMLSFSGGTIPADGSCTISVEVQVPGGTALGQYTNTTSAVTADFNGNTVTGNTATEILSVENVPSITKTFLTDPVVAGGTTTLEFTITNTSTTSALTNVDFNDNISEFISGTIVTSVPAAGSCGAGSFFFTQQINGQLNISVFDANVPAGGSCTFSFDLNIPSNTPTNTYTNTTTPVTGEVDGSLTTFGPATADLQVLATPRLTKSFIDDPVNPGDQVDLEFTLTYDEFATVDATNIAFTDDLNNTLSGLVATGTPISACGGTLTGTSNLSFSGGSLTPGETCTFTVTLQVPAGALPNTYPNTTSALTATIDGQAATSAAASDDLIIGGLSITKEFIGDPALPLDFISLRFTLENETNQDADILFFTDNLAATLNGLQVMSTATNTCGGTVGGNSSSIQYTGGTIPANSNCIVEVDLLVPANAQDGIYPNVTSDLLTSIGNAPPASDVLEINTDRLLLTKSFIDDPVQPGGNATVEYTLTNLDQDNAISNIAFTDDFGSALNGTTVDGVLIDLCGGTISGIGTGILNLSNIGLPAGASCTFRVSIAVPPTAPPGAIITSTTSDVDYTIGIVDLTAEPASDDLFIQGLNFSKTIAEPVVEGGTTIVTFSLTNTTSQAINDISFTDDLDAFIPGATVVTLPLSTSTCGAASGVTGTSVIDFGRGALPSGGSCTFDVEIMIPCGTTPGSYTNTTSAVAYQIGGMSSTSNPVSATVMVDPAPASGFFIALDDLCVNDGIQLGLSGGSPAGGSYSGPGVTDNMNDTYNFEPMLANLGSNTITYSVLDDNGCALVDYTDEVIVFGLPTVSFTAPADICENAPTLTDLGGGTPTGGFYFGAGVTDGMDGETYSFNPAAAGVGPHDLMYTFTDGNGCSNTASDDIEVFNAPDDVVVVQQNVSYCAPEADAAERQLVIEEPLGANETVVWILTDAPTGSAFDGSEPEEFTTGEMNMEFGIMDGNNGEILTMINRANGDAPAIYGTWSFDVKIINMYTLCETTVVSGFTATAYPAPEFTCLTNTVLIDETRSYTLEEADVVDINNFGNPPECSLTFTGASPSTFDCDDVGQTFSVVVSVEDADGTTFNCTATITVELDNSLPDGWSSSDVGNSGTLGNEYSFDPCANADGEFSITGGGMNATSFTTDNVAFASQTLCGDASITAKIESVDPNGYGGLMIRETTDAGAKQAAIFSNLTNLLRHESRFTTNGPKQVNAFYKPNPFWLRLTRMGDWIFAYYSTTGAPNTFQYVHGVFVPMNNCVELGLASFTYNPGQQTTAVFSNVQIDGGSMGGLDLPEVTTTFGNKQAPSLYPNPTNGIVNLVFEGGLSNDAIITLRNKLGQVIEQRELRISDFNTEWNVSTLADGLYFFEIRQEGEAVQVLRLVKTK